MSLIRCKTKHLIDLLTDLSHTAAADPDISGATAGVLLHTARGYADPSEPGETDLLVGTSCTTVHIGHTWVEAYGQTAPMLWPINDVRAVLSVFKVLAKGEKDHTVDIRSDGGEITVAEDPTAYVDGIQDYQPTGTQVWTFKGLRGPSAARSGKPPTS